MKERTMTPIAALNKLDAIPPDVELVFETDEGRIGGGYHVSELKLAKVKSVDCGGRTADWMEASLQLLDGHGGAYMTVGKFRDILRKSVDVVDGLGESPMHVEFAHGNIGLRIYQIGETELEGGIATVQLSDGRAACKPAVDLATGLAGTGSRAAEKPAACC